MCVLTLRVCVCVLVRTMSPAKTAKPIEMQFVGLDLRGRRNHYYTGARIPRGKEQFYGGDVVSCWHYGGLLLVVASLGGSPQLSTVCKSVQEVKEFR